ncbi:MAG: sporulation protein YhbH [Methylococcaceae bacterium]|nr:sporulation protein YhbH [Methylococcaceae bacterium]MCI0732795.1 sporulation protein YhbH [Methylococcaceae bacterium]
MSTSDTIFRPYSSSESLRSDRSAGDRQRHREKVLESIRDNISDLIAEEAIIGQSSDRIIKIPIRSIREYRFIYGKNSPGVGAGDGNTEEGQVVGRARGQEPGPGPAGNQPGIDYYETDVTLDELINIMFEDLALPDLEQKRLRQVLSERTFKRRGYRQVGVHAHLDKKRSARARVRRKMASKRVAVERSDGRFPFHQDDLKYRHRVPDMKPSSNAVVICIMDTSGSMDTMKKYLARSFFFLLHRFVCTRYQNVDLVFIAHHTQAREVTEEEFFHKGESGGTMISSGYNKALEVIRDRYHPDHWNIYAFHCSDGDNFESDNEATLRAADQLCEVCNLFGYGEIKPYTLHYESSLIEVFENIEAPNYQAVMIKRKEDVWPSFRALLRRERLPETTTTDTSA